MTEAETLWLILCASLLLNVGLGLILASSISDNHRYRARLSRFGVFDHDGDGKPGGSRPNPKRPSQGA